MTFLFRYNEQLKKNMVDRNVVVDASLKHE